MGANVQVVWEKFVRYFDVEPRYVDMAPGRTVIGVDEAMALVDENTIAVVGILGQHLHRRVRAHRRARRRTRRR